MVRGDIFDNYNDGKLTNRWRAINDHIIEVIKTYPGGSPVGSKHNFNDSHSQTLETYISQGYLKRGKEQNVLRVLNKIDRDDLHSPEQ